MVESVAEILQASCALKDVDFLVGFWILVLQSWYVTLGMDLTVRLIFGVDDRDEVRKIQLLSKHKWLNVVDPIGLVSCVTISVDTFLYVFRTGLLSTLDYVQDNATIVFNVTCYDLCGRIGGVHVCVSMKSSVQESHLKPERRIIQPLLDILLEHRSLMSSGHRRLTFKFGARQRDLNASDLIRLPSKIPTQLATPMDNINLKISVFIELR